MKIKIILLIVFILLITGCGNEEYEENKGDRFSNVYSGFTLTVYVDSETCVEYLSRAQGGIIVMKNADGTIKLNNNCLNDKEDNNE